MNDTLYIVMPAYNEEENISAVVKSWYKTLEDKSPDSRLIVADSGSDDNTHEILLSLCQTLPKLLILEDTLKQHGPKLIALYNFACANGAEYIFQTDSDGQTDPDEFEAFWNERYDYDALFGYRTRRGDGAGRMLVEKVLCLLLRIIFGIKVPDANAPFRLMKAESVKEYLDRFASDYSLPNVMLVTFFEHYRKKIMYREISFAARKAGKNSINIRRICTIGIGAIKGFCEYKKALL